MVIPRLRPTRFPTITRVPTLIRVPALTRVRPGAALGLAVCALLLLAALAPGLLSGTGPDAASPADSLLPPGAAHWMGTDENGRDVYSRVVHGARPSLLIGLSASALALAAGTVIGVLAAQGGRTVDRVAGRLLDVLMSVPGVLLVLLVVAVLGTGTGNLVAGLALVTLPGYARLVRAEVLRVRGTDYVEAATVLGWSRSQVVLRHIVPNAVGPLLALATVGVGGMIVTGSALSFLGLGPQPPTAEWGAMLAGSGDYVEVAWWTAVFPGAAITLTVLAVSAVGQWLQDRAEGRVAR